MRSHQPDERRQGTTGSGRRHTCAVILVAGSCFALGNVVALGCAREPLSDGLSERTDCTGCHGSTANAAPPKGVNGTVGTTEIGIGAHQNHLLGSEIAGPVACIECHRLPTDMLTHPDVDPRPALVVFGALASTSGAKPNWDRASAVCSNAYCHGATLSGAASRAAPVWTRVDGSQRRCNSCHGFPPVTPSHQADVVCEHCHGSVAGPGSTIKDPSHHANGIIDIGSASTAENATGAAQQGGDAS